MLPVADDASWSGGVVDFGGSMFGPPRHRQKLWRILRLDGMVSNKHHGPSVLRPSKGVDDMKLSGIKPMEDTHVNVTPLIDIVMCLIIFFLLVGHIAKAAAVKGVKVPVAKSGKDLRNKSNQLIVNLVPSRAYVGQGRRPMISIWGQDVSYENLAAYLRQQKRDNPKMKLILRADRSIPYKYVAPVLISCAQAGIASIHFMTRRPG